MAQRTVVIYEDDLNGKPADETVEFGLDGVHYEIDLTTANVERLRKAFEPYVEKARRKGGRKRRTTASSGPRRPSTGGSAVRPYETTAGP